MSTSPFTCLNLDRTLDFVADLQGVQTLLLTLGQTLQTDLSRLQDLLDAGDLPGIHEVLHQIKGFAPAFCTDALVAEVVRVEGLSRGEDLQAVRTAYAQLGPLLERLLAEVQAQLATPR